MCCWQLEFLIKQGHTCGGANLWRNKAKAYRKNDRGWSQEVANLPYNQPQKNRSHLLAYKNFQCRPLQADKAGGYQRHTSEAEMAVDRSYPSKRRWWYRQGCTSVDCWGKAKTGPPQVHMEKDSGVWIEAAEYEMGVSCEAPKRPRRTMMTLMMMKKYGGIACRIILKLWMVPQPQRKEKKSFISSKTLPELQSY